MIIWMIDKLTLFLWEGIPVFRSFVFYFLGATLLFYFWTVYRYGYKKYSPYVLGVLTWTVAYLSIYEVKVDAFDWSLYRLLYLVHPIVTTLLAFSLFLFLRGVAKFTLLLLMVWMFVLLVNIFQPFVLSETVRPPLWWVPSNNLFIVNASWLILSLIGLIGVSDLHSRSISVFLLTRLSTIVIS